MTFCRVLDRRDDTAGNRIGDVMRKLIGVEQRVFELEKQRGGR